MTRAIIASLMAATMLTPVLAVGQAEAGPKQSFRTAPVAKMQMKPATMKFRSMSVASKKPAKTVMTSQLKTKTLKTTAVKKSYTLVNSGIKTKSDKAKLAPLDSKTKFKDAGVVDKSKVGSILTKNDKPSSPTGPIFNKDGSVTLPGKKDSKVGQIDPKLKDKIGDLIGTGKDPGKTDPPKTDPPKTDPGKTDPGKTTDPTKPTDPPKTGDMGDGKGKGKGKGPWGGIQVSVTGGLPVAPEYYAPPVYRAQAPVYVDRPVVVSKPVQAAKPVTTDPVCVEPIAVMDEGQRKTYCLKWFFRGHLYSPEQFAMLMEQMQAAQSAQ
jgi:hypothetical protein